MSQIQGFLSKIEAKPTNFGTMYDLVMDDGKSYGTGKNEPKFVSAGDYIKFEATQKPGSKFWNVQAGSLSKENKPAGVSPAATPARSTGGYDDGGRQDRISKQWAINASVQYVKILLDAGALPFAANAKTDKKADLIKHLVMDTAKEFYHLGTGETYAMPETDSMDISAAEADTDWNE